MCEKVERHIPVLFNELVEAIAISDNRQDIIVDATLWMWWHATEVIKKMKKWDIFIWFDADKRNLDIASKKLEQTFKDSWVKLIFINSNFVNLKEELSNIDIDSITWIYFDLWLSSLHLDEADRWFSFMLEWPLDMRLDNNRWRTAADIVNSYKQEDLREIFLKYSEEPWSNKISARIVEHRRNEKFKTTTQLSDVIPGGPKTKARIFQALRIEVNNELENMEIALNDAITLLQKDWNIFVISFHSLEDRITKHIFKKEARDCFCTDIICTCKHERQIKVHTKKPILPTEEEIKNNKRSRSAKARFATKL